MAIKCPDCGAYNLSSAETCKKCGASLGPSLVQKTEAAPQKTPFIKRIIPRFGSTKKS
ncbi:MAG TPA: hypothetical protein GX509_00775 [Firmicutes bacterium]|nr:hypothetical protein [Bacillota bacterium]HHY97249.1 hypothetical protein [Bacillota bacterium]